MSARRWLPLALLLAGCNGFTKLGDYTYDLAQWCNDRLWSGEKVPDECKPYIVVDAGAGMVVHANQSCIGDPSSACQGKNCCESHMMPTEPYPMGRGTEVCTTCVAGCPDVCSDEEQPEHQVTLHLFYLDSFEVTVGRFRAFVDAYDKPSLATLLEAGAGKHPRIDGTEWSGGWSAELPADRTALLESISCGSEQQAWSDEPADRETWPMNCITWYLSYAFCAWDGGRLPTEAEWEFAAANGANNTLYPWGSDAPTADLAVSGAGTLVPVGSKPLGVSPFGLYDVAGSVFEWVFDAWAADWYEGAGNDCSDCANLTGDTRVRRGGCWNSPEMALRAVYRTTFIAPRDKRNNTGVRCARDL